MVIGAHPDDAEFQAGGLAALCVAKGWRVRFVAVTSGNAGHQNMKSAPLAARRLKEARRAAAHMGADFITLGEPDGRLFVDKRSTDKVVSAIREFHPEVVVSHRTYDYHRDHRYSGQLVLDASFILQVPLAYPRKPPMTRMPVILYSYDSFTEGPLFRPDLVIRIDAVHTKVVAGLMEHESQWLEWIPWVDGRKEISIRHPRTDRKAVAAELAAHAQRVAKKYARELRAKYRVAPKAAEAFQVCQYGRRPDAATLCALLPF
jgi:LmbE family N-acetylglucosaminyl deacetylase